MSRPRTGAVRLRNGKIYVRVSYLDEHGKQKWIEKRAPSKQDAPIVLRRLMNDLDSGGAEYLLAEQMTFTQLAERYRAHKVFPAEYAGDRKIAGLRDSRMTSGRLDMLISYFGRRRVRSITPGDLERFKRDRLSTPVLFGKDKKKIRPRTITTVNREMQMLRAVLYFAQREGWLLTNPFQRLKGIISSADETKRERILSRDEEAKLLEACTGQRAYLRPLIILALDTGMRRGEMLALT